MLIGNGDSQNLKTVWQFYRGHINWSIEDFYFKITNLANICFNVMVNFGKILAAILMVIYFSFLQFFFKHIQLKIHAAFLFLPFWFLAVIFLNQIVLLQSRDRDFVSAGGSLFHSTVHWDDMTHTSFIENSMIWQYQCAPRDTWRKF